MPTQRRRRRPRLTILQKEQKKFRASILKIFNFMGFRHLRTQNKTYEFGGQRGEFDYVFLYENIIIICEDTLGSSDTDHLRTKYFFYEKIRENRNEFLQLLKRDYQDKFDEFRGYTEGRYKLFYIYIHKSPIDSDTKEPFQHFKFINDSDRIYFHKIASILKKTSRNELYKFLNLDLSEVGAPASSTEENKIDTAVILPEESSGYPEGIKIVSFLISAKDLMDCSYVLRKESWHEGAELYQRLLLQNKIKDIREYIANKKRVFLNNIIVSLPNEVTLYRKVNGSEEKIEPDNLCDIENLKMRFPKKINSIGIIDGQHRVFAHYEGNDKHEDIVSRLKVDRHLLTTGLLFPSSISTQEKIKLESEIFLQINSTQKKVDTALLQHIEAIKDPYSPLGIARKVLVLLNEREPFLDKFQIYTFETKKIKTPSIINWGLKELVEMDNEKETLFKYWQHDDKSLLLSEERGQDADIVFQEYLRFSASIISQYFGAVKENFSDFWLLDPSSKLLKVTAITGFLISLRMSLRIYQGYKDFAFYRQKLSNLNVDFSKENFQYISSHWHKFAQDIRDLCWTNT